MRFGMLHASAIALLAACGTATSPTPASANNAADQARQAPQAQPRAQSERPFTVSEVATFSTPWAMSFLPGSGVPKTNVALVTEREGRLWLIDVTSGERRPVSGVPNVRVERQGGLGDVVAHPDFAGNQRIYLSYAEAGPDNTAGAAVGYGRLVLGQGEPRIDGFRVIWRQTPKVTGGGHFGHRLAFSPDGHLFVTSGDREKMQPAQDPNSDLGKIIRMTAEGEPVAGSPWAGDGGRRAFHWSMGHRNNLGLAFAPDGRLWASEMGPRHGDELNLILPGRNYGWPEVSYGRHYDNRAIPDEHAPRGFEEPKLWWDPAISPGGLMIYTGDLFPQWRGNAFLPGLSGQNLVRVELDGDNAREAQRWDMEARIRAVVQGPRGEIYLLEDGRSPGQGRLLRLEPRR